MLIRAVTRADSKIEVEREREGEREKEKQALNKSYRDLSRCIGIGARPIAEAERPPLALHLGNHLAVEEAEQRRHAQTLQMKKREGGGCKTVVRQNYYPSQAQVVSAYWIPLLPFFP